MNFIYDEKKNQILFIGGVISIYWRRIMETNHIDNKERELINSLDEIDLSKIKNDEENSKLLKNLQKHSSKRKRLR